MPEGRAQSGQVRDTASREDAGTIARVVLDAFLAGLVVVLAAMAFVVVRGVALWRQAKRAGRELGAELVSFEERSAMAEQHLAAWESSSRELDLALGRLRESQARLTILVDAIEQAQARVRWLRVFVPR